MAWGGHKEAAARIAGAIAFLTRIPIPKRGAVAAIGPSMAAFPLVGALIGLACALVYAGVAERTPLLAAVLAVSFGMAATGALHEDGLADSADGLAGRDRTEALAIMRDTRLGTYGVLALTLTTAARIAALSCLAPATALLILPAAGGFSRLLMVWLLWAVSPARDDGLSVEAGRPDWNTTIIAVTTGAFGAAVLLGIGTSLIGALAALAIASLVAWAIRWAALRRLRGQTGDVCGALQVLSETAMLTTVALTIR